MSGAGERALQEAVETIERASSAEIVVAVRPRAQRWYAPHAAVGLTCALALLLYTLYSPIEFTIELIWAMPLLAGVIGAVLVETVAPLYRFIAPLALRRDHVRVAARAEFVARQVHATQRRGGILVYIAVRERVVELIGDIAITRRFAPEVLARWQDELAAQIPHGAEAVAQRLAGLAEPLGQALPHHADDLNELPDAIATIRPRGLRLLHRGSR